MASAPVVTKPAKPGTRSVRTTELICVKTRYNFVRASRKLIVEWIWQKSYELELSREQFSLAVGILDFIVSSVKLKEPSGPPTLLGAASIAIATTLEGNVIYILDCICPDLDDLNGGKSWLQATLFELLSMPSPFQWFPTLEKFTSMYLNTMFHLSDASVKRRNLCQADVEVSVLHPAAHLTVSNSLFRARCDKASLVFSDSKLAAAMLYIQFEKNFIPDNVAVFDAFKAVTGYRIDSLQHAVAFVRAYHSRIHLRLNIAYPGRNDITDEEVLYSQSYPFHLGDTDGF